MSILSRLSNPLIRSQGMFLPKTPTRPIIAGISNFALPKVRTIQSTNYSTNLAKNVFVKAISNKAEQGESVGEINRLFRKTTLKDKKNRNEKMYPDFTIEAHGKQVKPKHADACGNTFLIYDLLDTDLDELSWETVRKAIWNITKLGLVDDALVLRTVSRNSKALSVKMHVLEPDGTEADFCGNGARATGTYLLQKYGVKYPQYSLVSVRGNHPVSNQTGTCFIKMADPVINPKMIVFPFKGKEIHLTFVDTAEPHLITADFFDEKTLTELGDAINKDLKSRYPHGVNVNCVKSYDETISVITYERGLYRITKACGTGSTAACAAAIYHNWIPLKPSYNIQVLGGTLQIKRDEQNHFWLGGPVIFATPV